ncbi:hypothetical protein HDU67_000780 [Dinochytrium kinnereticum]|nr:hypothetical protein HDU67_000780 [Dinochytrium kinnereticum]
MPMEERRAGEADFKVLMLKRNARGLFGNLHVFPGGALDEADFQEDWGDILPKSFAARQTSPYKDLRPFAIAAVRETFEECGIALLSPMPSWSQQEAVEWREKVHNDGSTFPSLCKTLKTAPNLPQLIHWAHWITPEIEKKRFDTQFFLTVLEKPEASGVSVDGKETVSLKWFTPSEALDAFSKGDIRLFPPQFLTLTELTGMTLKTLASYLLPSGGTPRPVEAFLPEPILHTELGSEEGRGAMALPGDEKHSTAEAKGLVGTGAMHRVLLSRDLGEARKRNEDVGAKKGEVGAVAGITSLKVIVRGAGGKTKL